MNIKKLFGVLFIVVMLLSVPCVYATEYSSNNNEIKEVTLTGDGHINPMMQKAIAISADIISVESSISRINPSESHVSRLSGDVVTVQSLLPIHSGAEFKLQESVVNRREFRPNNPIHVLELEDHTEVKLIK